MKVLVVSPDTARASAIAGACRAQGVSCEVAGGGLYALTWLERNRADLIVSAADLGDLSGLDLIEIVREDTALQALRFLLLDEDAEQWLTHSADATLSKTSTAADIAKAVVEALRPPPPPVPSPELPRRLASEANPHMTGTFEIITLFDLLVSLSQAGRTSKLRVWLSGREACIYLCQGRVIHAEFGHYRGREAFTHIFVCNEQASNTQFMVEGLDTIGLRPTIHQSINQLLLEVAVELDQVRNNKLGV